MHTSAAAQRTQGSYLSPGVINGEPVKVSPEFVDAIEKIIPSLQQGHQAAATQMLNALRAGPKIGLEPPKAFCGKLGAWPTLLRQPVYRNIVGSMAINSVGQGVMTAGHYYLIAELARYDFGLQMFGMGAYNLVPTIIGSVVSSWMSNMRDNVENHRRLQEMQGISALDRPDEKHSHTHRVHLGGWLNLTSGCLLVLAVAGQAFYGLGAGGLFSAQAIITSIDAFNQSYASGAWNNLKYYTGDMHLNMKFTIGSIEVSINGLLWGLSQFATAVGFYFLSKASGQEAAAYRIALVTLGTVLYSAPNLLFDRCCIAQAPTKPQESADETDPYTDLLRF